MFALLLWWLVLELVGLLALPITMKLLRFLPDRGVGFARQVGLLLSGYLFWLLVTLGLVPNTTSSAVFVLLLVGCLSAWLWQREGPRLRAALVAGKGLILTTEILFLVALAAFALFRAYNPEIAYTEKPMEFGFINAILRSRTFPPRDQWLSGYAISYYYFGYVIAAFLTRLSGLASDVTFNLTGITLFALTVNGAFSLVYNLAQAYLDHRQGIGEALGRAVSRAGILAGLWGALLVALMGNLEGVFEVLRARGGGSEALWRWLDVKNLQATAPSSTWYPTDGWWWWRASRVIHDRDALGQSMEVIDEFPFFSFLLGDNHPHVLTLPFVFLALALALNLLLSRSDAQAQEPSSNGGRWAKLWQSAQALWAGGPGELLLWGLLLGALGFLNTWDYPIYLGLFVLAYAIQRQRAHGRPGWGWLGDTISLGLILLALGLFLYLPFYLGFRSQAGGLGLVQGIKTRLHQYLLMFGAFIYPAASLVVALLVRQRRASPEMRRWPLGAQIAGGAALALTFLSLTQGWWTAALTFGLAGLAGVVLLWGNQPMTAQAEPRPRLEASTLMALLCLVAGLLLTASVEFIFLRDTFGTRMNTVFKFYYQAWVLLGIAAAYGSFYLVEQLRRGTVWARAGLGLWAAVMLLLVAAGLTYTVTATASKANGFQGQPTLDGTRYVAQYRPDEYAAIQWLRAHAKPDAVMAEAPGGSYSEYNWVSAHTGIPTVLGWGGHELQWRGNYDEPARREPDLATLYQSTDAAQTWALLDKYGITYVYVGPLERNKYRLNQAMLRKFDQLMGRAFEQGTVVIYER